MALAGLRRAVLERLALEGRRATAHARDHLEGGIEGGLFGAGLAQLPVGAAGVLTGGYFGGADPEEMAEIHVGGGLAGAALVGGANLIGGKRGAMRAMLSGMHAFRPNAGNFANTVGVDAEAGRSLNEYVRHLRRIGFDEEADAAERMAQLPRDAIPGDTRRERDANFMSMLSREEEKARRQARHGSGGRAARQRGPASMRDDPPLDRDIARSIGQVRDSVNDDGTPFDGWMGLNAQSDEFPSRREHMPHLIERQQYVDHDNYTRHGDTLTMRDILRSRDRAKLLRSHLGDYGVGERDQNIPLLAIGGAVSAPAIAAALRERDNLRG